MLCVERVGGGVATTHKDGAGGPPVCDESCVCVLALLFASWASSSSTSASSRTGAPVAPPPHSSLVSRQPRSLRHCLRRHRINTQGSGGRKIKTERTRKKSELYNYYYSYYIFYTSDEWSRLETSSQEVVFLSDGGAAALLYRAEVEQELPPLLLLLGSSVPPTTSPGGSQSCDEASPTPPPCSADRCRLRRTIRSRGRCSQKHTQSKIYNSIFYKYISN